MDLFMAEENTQAAEMVNGLIKRSQHAQAILSTFTQEQVDKICEAIAKAGKEHAQELAQAAVQETRRGVVADKVTKNIFASECIWESLKDVKTVGVVSEDEDKGLVSIAEPMGVIAGVTPVTNPTSTVIFKSMIALKTRNTIVFGFHPQAQKSCVMAGKLVEAAAEAAGAPKDSILWIEEPSLEATTALMHNPNVSLILATGGPSMVSAAYSSGKPALGVGPGNGPAYVAESANVTKAIDDIVTSKTFDNGMICASENSIVVDASIYDEVKELLKGHGAYFLNDEQVPEFSKAFIDEKRGTVRGMLAGKSAKEIATLCSLEVPADTRIIVAELDGVGREYPLSAEKLSPVLSMYKAKDAKEAFFICQQLLDYGGRGHTAAIHSEDHNLIVKFASEMTACRILVNTPSALGGVGGLYNNLTPSLTLGTGTYGGNAVSHNITATDLLNMKTVAFRHETDFLKSLN